MNQVLKDTVYRLGNRSQVEFVARVGGMNEEEAKVLLLIHEGHTDVYIQEEMALSRTAYSRIESAVRAKLLLAIFDCINKCMD